MLQIPRGKHDSYAMQFITSKTMCDYASTMHVFVINEHLGTYNSIIL